MSNAPDILLPCNAPGEHWFHVVAVDTLGNHSPAAHYRFEVLDAAPVVTSSTHPNPNLSYDGIEVTLDWTSGGVPDVERYYYSFNNAPDSIPDTILEAETLTFDCVEPGVYWFHIQSLDACGFFSPVAHRRVAVATTPGPVVTSSSHPVPSQAYAARDVELSLGGEGSAPPYNYVWDRNPYTVPGTGSSVSADGSIPTIENAAIGRHFLHARSVDDCGTPTATTHFPVRIREARAPVVTVTPTSNKTTMTFSWTDPDGFATGTPKYFFAFDASATTEPGPGSSSTSNTVRNEFNSPLGLRFFHVRGQDTHGNLTPTAHYAVIVGDTLVGLSAPSETITRNGPVSYLVTYPGATSVSLSPANITLDKTDTANGTVSVQSTEDAVVKRITISNITGDGTLGITIAAGTAAYPGAFTAPAIGPSATFAVDNTAPQIELNGPDPAITNDGPVVYTLTYSGAQDILLQQPDLTLAADPPGEVGATIALSGDANVRTITLTNIFGDGTLTPAIVAGTAVDAAGNLSSGLTGDSVTIDNTPPTLSISLPSSLLTQHGPIDYTLTYGGADAISLDPADITLASTPPGGATGTVGISGTGDTRTLHITNIQGDGLLRPTVAAATANDLAGNTTPSVQGIGFVVDNTPPGIALDGPGFSATNTGPAEYTITYTGADTVTLDESDIDLVATGTAMATMTLSGSGTAQRGITLSDIQGDGTLRLEIAEGTASDLVGHIAPGISSEELLVDNTAPTLDISGPEPAVALAGPVEYILSYEGADTIELTQDDVAIESSDVGTFGGPLILAPIDENTWKASLLTVTGEGTLRIVVPAGTGSDIAGNTTPEVFSLPVTVDTIAPQVSISEPSASVSNGEAITYEVTFNGADTVSLSLNDVSLVTTGDARGTLAVAGTGATTRTVTIREPSGVGSIGIAIAAGSAQDAAGNLAVAAGPSSTFEVNFYRLRIAAYGDGATTPEAGEYIQAPLSQVNLQATPAEGWQLLHWVINGTPNNDVSIELGMDEDITAIALFNREGIHNGDLDGSSAMSLAELLRFIQLYNADGYSCAPDFSGSEDGFLPGNGGLRECLPHAGDYAPQDWIISLSELLRIIQLFSVGAYHPCLDGEGGFCAGLA